MTQGKDKQVVRESKCSRRDLLKKMMVAGGSVLLGGNLLRSKAPFAQTKKLTKVTLSYGVQTMDVTEAFFSSVPKGLGYYDEEGLTVDILPVAGASAAIQLLASGRTDFSSHGTPGLFAAIGRGMPIKAFICQVPEYFASIAVLKSGPITDVKNLRGKVIGINALGGAPHLILKGVFSSLGMDPENDVKYLAVGTGVPAIDALNRGRVDALFLWDSILAQFEFLGFELRYFRPEPIPSIGFTHSTNTLISTIESKPEVVRGMARAMAKSMVFMAAVNPSELVKLHFSIYPESKPGNVSESEAIRFGVLKLHARQPFMQYKERVFDRTIKLGSISKEKIERCRDIMLAGGEIPKALPADMYFTNQFVEDMNKIDFEGIIKKARSFKA